MTTNSNLNYILYFQINQWMEEAGGDITVNYFIKDPKAAKTNADETNPMWVVLQNTAREL